MSRRLSNAEVDAYFAALIHAIMKKPSQAPQNVVKVGSKIRNAVEYLRTLKEADEKCVALGLNFSRSCGGCGSENPCTRVFSTACGHAFCRECADGKEACLVCEKSTSFLPLYEGDSRECQVCCNETPRTRGIYTSCGHVLCYTCIVQIPAKAQSSCPFCRKKSKKIVVLKEKIIVEDHVLAKYIPIISAASYVIDYSLKLYRFQ